MRRQGPRDPFGIVYRHSLESPEIRALSAKAFRVWVCLLTFVQPGCSWKVGVDRLAKVTGYSRRTVQLALRELEGGTLKLRKRHADEPERTEERVPIVERHETKRKNGSQCAHEWVLRDPRPHDGRGGDPSVHGGGDPSVHGGGEHWDRPLGVNTGIALPDQSDQYVQTGHEPNDPDHEPELDPSEIDAGVADAIDRWQNGDGQDSSAWVMELPPSVRERFIAWMSLPAHRRPATA